MIDIELLNYHHKISKNVVCYSRPECKVFALFTSFLTSTEISTHKLYYYIPLLWWHICAFTDHFIRYLVLSSDCSDLICKESFIVPSTAVFLCYGWQTSFTWQNRSRFHASDALKFPHCVVCALSPLCLRLSLYFWTPLFMRTSVCHPSKFSI